jgi:hypothetical protein
MVTFSRANTELQKMAVELGIPKSHIKSFDLPAGWTCPYANICKSQYNPISGVTIDGKNMIFRCYAMKAERQYPATRVMRWRNFNELKNCNNDVDKMASVISNSIPNRTEIVRIHSSGDFFSKAYFQAWVKVAIKNPEIQFYGYTKALQYVNIDKPDNFNLIYSIGGKLDKVYTNEPACYVVQSPDEADAKNIPLACVEIEDDYINILQGKSFALLEH